MHTVHIIEVLNALEKRIEKLEDILLVNKKFVCQKCRDTGKVDTNAQCHCVWKYNPESGKL